MNGYLKFSLNGKGYLVKLEDVIEVIEPQKVFSVPGAPGQFRGVINYKGTAVPVMETAVSFERKESKSARIVLLRAKLQALAICADGVTGAVEPAQDELKGAAVVNVEKLPDERIWSEGLSER